MPQTIREYRLEQAVAFYQKTLRKILVDGYTYSGGCSDPDCICHIPGPICEEFMGMIHPDGQPDPTSTKCPRCGWDWNAHQENQ